MFTQNQVQKGTFLHNLNFLSLPFCQLFTSICLWKPICSGPLNSSAKKQRRVLETMVSREGLHILTYNYSFSLVKKTVM